MGFIAAVPAAIGTVLTASTASTAAIAAASVTLTEATAALTAVGAGVAGYSAIKQSQYQGAVAKQNALIAKNNADSSLLAGNSAEEASRLATGRKVGAALAAQGANGVDVSYGSPASLRGALVSEGDLDALTIRHNAATNAMNYMQQSGGFTAEASVDAAAARNTAVGTVLNVGASYIGGAASTSAKYSTYKTLGVPGF